MKSIFQAVRDNDPDAIRKMLHSQPELIKAINELHDTLLHEAVRLGCIKIMSVLIEAGAYVNAKGDLGNTPLHYAAENEQPVELAALLIEAGAAIEHPNQRGETPLSIAAAQNVEVAHFLLQHGATLDLNSAVLLGSVEQVRRLLSEDPSFRDVRFPDELLRQAITANSPEILQALLSHGVKPNSLALFEALSRVLNGASDLAVLRMLLSAGADPNARLYGSSGEKALEYAEMFEGDLAEHVVALLKRYGARR